MAKKSRTQKKKQDIRQYAPIGLWIFGLAVLSIIILLVFKLLAYIGFSTPTTQETQRLNLALWISLGVAVIGPALYALLDPDRVREFLTGRQARHGSNALILLFAFIGILLVVNILIFNNPANWDLDWDWTEDKQNTLAPETLDTLNALPGPVHVIGFYTQRSNSTSTQELLDSLKSKSNGKLDYEIIDPERNPVLAQQYNVTRDGTVVLTLEDRQEMVNFVTEQEMTNALVRLMNPGQRTVYFLTGHGEYDILGTSERGGYTRARAVLEAKNYTVRTLNLRAQNLVPEDALVIIVAGPTQPVTAEEMLLLEDYLTGGGSLVLLAEPAILADLGGQADPLADYLALTWGIVLNNDLVIDTNTGQPLIAIADSYGSHPITERMQNILSFYPTARSLFLLAPETNAQASPLVQTNDRAWGETDFEALQNDELSYDPESDFLGPLVLAAAAENWETTGRVVVVGDADFASDTYFDQYANGDLLINSVDWAAQQESMISLTAKTPIVRQMSLVSNATLVMLAISFVCLIPGVVVGGGVAAWLVRRSRG